MIHIIEDVEKLTNVKQHVLSKIISCTNFAIVDNVIECLYNDTSCIDIDVGIGTLSIDVVDDTIQYFFKPSSELESSLIRGINNNENILESKLSSSIDKYIYKTYKDML